MIGEIGTHYEIVVSERYYYFSEELIEQNLGE